MANDVFRLFSIFLMCEEFEDGCDCTDCEMLEDEILDELDEESEEELEYLMDCLDE